MRHSKLIKALCITVIILGAAALIFAAFGFRRALSDYKAAEDERALFAADIEKLEDCEAELAEKSRRYSEDSDALKKAELEHAGTLQAVAQGKASVLAGETELNAGYSAYNYGVSRYNQSYAQYEAGAAAVEQGASAYESGKTALEMNRGMYGLAKGFTDAYARTGLFLPITGAVAGAVERNIVEPYEQGQEQLRAYEEGSARLAEAKNALDSGKAALDNAGYRLQTGKAELEKGRTAVEEYEGKLESQEDEIARLSASVSEYEETEKEAETLRNSLRGNSDVEEYVNGGRSAAEAARLAERDRENEAAAGLNLNLIINFILAVVSAAIIVFGAMTLAKNKKRIIIPDTSDADE